MRLIGELPNDEQARKLCAFLLAESIESHVDGKPEGPFEIWVKDEDRFKQALQAFEEFTANPEDAKYNSAINKADAILREREKKRREHHKNVVHSPALMKAGAKRGSFFQQAPLTAVLIGICALVAVLTDFGSMENQDRAICRALNFVSVESPSEQLVELAKTNSDDYRVRLASILRGEVWRMVSPIFIHLSPIHILFNMLWLVQLGRIIEIRYGTFRLAMLVLITAALSNLAQCLVPVDWGGCKPILDSHFLSTRLGGMSGVIYGLFGYIWMKSVYDPTSRLNLTQATVFIMIGWLFFCIVSPNAGGMLGDNARVANWAHAIGLIVGMALAFFPFPSSKD